MKRSPPPASDEPEGRDRILREATRLFLQLGFAGTSINQIAEATGMAKSAVYHHFASKEALFLAAMQGVVGKFVSCLQESTQGQSWREQLTNGASGLARFFAEQRLDIPALLRDLGQVGSVDFITMRNQLAPVALAPLTRAIEAGQAAGEVTAGDSLWSAWMLVVLVGVSTRPLAREAATDVSQQAINFFLRGIEAKQTLPSGPGPAGQQDRTDRGEP